MTTPFPDPSPSLSFRGSYHRRAQSEVQFRIPDDLDLLQDPFDGPSGSFEELGGSEDDLFCTYMDIEKLGSKLDDGPSDPKLENPGGSAETGVELGGEMSARPRHQHSNSLDASLDLHQQLSAPTEMNNFLVKRKAPTDNYDDAPHHHFIYLFIIILYYLMLIFCRRDGDNIYIVGNTT